MNISLKGNNSTNFLKLIGLVTMTIDHFGKIFYSSEIIYQLIGRLTFPIFAYCLVVGFMNTSNVKKYLIRLLVVGVISQPFYSWAFEYSIYELNIFFTLSLCLVSLIFMSNRQWLLYFISLLVPAFIKLDYGIHGVILVGLMYQFRDQTTILIPSLVLNFAAQLFLDLTEIVHIIFWQQKLIVRPSPSLNVFGFLFIPFCYLRYKIPSNINKFFFYSFYPLHLFAFSLMKHWHFILYR